MLAHETAVTTDIASTEPAIARSDSPERLALRRPVQLIATTKDIALEDLASATHNTMDEIALSNSAPTAAQELVHALT